MEEEMPPSQYQDPQAPATLASPSAEIANTSKRQRRPSVRLVEIGDQPAANWKEPSKIRKLDKLSAGDETLGLIDEEGRDLSYDNLAIGTWRTKDLKSKRVAKKPRSNWIPKISDPEEGSKSGRGDDEDDDELGLGGSQLRRSHHSSSRVKDEDDLDGPLDVGSEDGVKNWLEGLGLRRYWPVFEIHEVNEEVLPLLTLDDLKDMGINAVGSRRKMFAAIQKLRKGFSS